MSHIKDWWGGWGGRGCERGHIWTLWTHQAGRTYAVDAHTDEDHPHHHHHPRPHTPTVFTPGNTSMFLIQESVCLRFNPRATNFPFAFPPLGPQTRASSSGSHHAVLRASIAHMSCALQVGIPRRKVEHFPLGNSHRRKRPASEKAAFCAFTDAFAPAAAR